MRKIKLELEKLEVVSFDTAEAPDARGTVDGHGHVPPTDAAAPSCGYTCDGYYHTCAHQTCYTWGVEVECGGTYLSIRNQCQTDRCADLPTG
jgi:hypothetical protein